MNFSLHADQKRIWGTQPVGIEEIALKLIIKKFFVFCGGPFRAWLIFDKKTGNGFALAAGPFQPNPTARRKMARMKLPIGVAEVNPKFQELLLHHGPEALRWDGHEVVVNGN